MSDYCERLIAYVMGHGGKSREQAEAWLDTECPAWRMGQPPQAGTIEVSSEDDE
jgi:hypothetical protein